MRGVGRAVDRVRGDPFQLRPTRSADAATLPRVPASASFSPTSAVVPRQGAACSSSMNEPTISRGKALPDSRSSVAHASRIVIGLR